MGGVATTQAPPAQAMPRVPSVAAHDPPTGTWVAAAAAVPSGHAPGRSGTAAGKARSTHCAASGGGAVASSVPQEYRSAYGAVASSVPQECRSAYGRTSDCCPGFMSFARGGSTGAAQFHGASRAHEIGGYGSAGFDQDLGCGAGTAEHYAAPHGQLGRSGRAGVSHCQGAPRDHAAPAYGAAGTPAPGAAAPASRSSTGVAGDARLRASYSSQVARMRGGSAGMALDDDFAALIDLLLRRRRELPEPSPELIAALRGRLDCLRGECFGVTPADLARLPERYSCGYQEVLSSRDMTVAVFFLRAGTSLPLHDHPGMHVFGRLLFGQMRVLNFDPVPGSPPPVGGPEGSFLATLRDDAVLGPHAVTYGLGPNEGNYHELHALEDTAFFDVLSPPYDEYAGRDCNYFRRERVAEDGEADARPGRLEILVPIRAPYLKMGTLEYRGPYLGALAERVRHDEERAEINL